MRSGRLTLATVGVAVGLAAMLVPETLVGREPDVRVLIVGLVLGACGLAIPAGDGARWCGALLVGAGFAWFLPSFDVTGREGIDRAIASTSLLHIALIASAIVVVPVGAIRARGMAVALVPAYVAAISAAVGGYRFALIAAGVALAVVVAVAWSRLSNRTTGAALAFCTAGLALGFELVLSGVLRLAVGSPPERTLSLFHEAALAIAAALVLTAATRTRTGDASISAKAAPTQSSPRSPGLSTTRVQPSGFLIMTAAGSTLLGAPVELRWGRGRKFVRTARSSQ